MNDTPCQVHRNRIGTKPKHLKYTWTCKQKTKKYTWTDSAFFFIILFFINPNHYQVKRNTSWGPPCTSHYWAAPTPHMASNPRNIDFLKPCPRLFFWVLLKYKRQFGAALLEGRRIEVEDQVMVREGKEKKKASAIYTLISQSTVIIRVQACTANESLVVHGEASAP